MHFANRGVQLRAGTAVAEFAKIPTLALMPIGRFRIFRHDPTKKTQEGNAVC